MNIFCKLGFHSFHTAPNGMLRWCPNCNLWEVNLNLNYDPIKRWRLIEEPERLRLTKLWYEAGKTI